MSEAHRVAALKGWTPEHREARSRVMVEINKNSKTKRSKSMLEYWEHKITPSSDASRRQTALLFSDRRQVTALQKRASTELNEDSIREGVLNSLKMKKLAVNEYGYSGRLRVQK